VILRVVFWVSLAALVWTHAGYPAAAAALSRHLRASDTTAA